MSARRWALGAALLAVSVGSGCAPEYQEPPAPLTPLVEPSEAPPPVTLLEVPTTTTAPPAPSSTIALQPTPTLYAPGTEFEMSVEQFYATFGVWPTCDAVANQDWACLVP